MQSLIDEYGDKRITEDIIREGKEFNSRKCGTVL